MTPTTLLSIRTLARDGSAKPRAVTSASPKSGRMETFGGYQEGEGDAYERVDDYSSSDEEDVAVESVESEVIASGCSDNDSGNGDVRSGGGLAHLVLLQYPSSSSLLTSSSHSTSSNRSESAPLPPLSSAGVRIQTPLLFPVVVTPQQVPRATEIQLFLNRIEHIEINSVIEREDNVIYYILDIYRFRQQNGIPTRRTPTTAAPPLSQQQKYLQKSDSLQHREPDYRIEHRYSSFARLRSNVWQTARKRHPRRRSCCYCGSLINFFLQTDAQPNLKVKFTTTTDKRKEILSKFINDLLVATRDNHVHCARSMRGYHQIPMLMRRFLNEQTGETFFT